MYGDPRTVGVPCWLLWLTVAFAALPTSVAGQPARPCGGDSRRPLVYTGDRDFPPYEYLDKRDTPAGFNIQMLHALSRELQLPIEIRLLPTADAREARERGTGDLFSAGYVPARDDQFDFLVATTTIRSSILLRPGRNSYPSNASEVKGLRIAIQDGAPSVAGFDALPPEERPTIVATVSHRASIALLVARQVDAAAGSGAALRWHALDAGIEDLVEVPVNTRPYMLVTRKGCAAAMGAVVGAVERLKEQGVIDQIADDALAPRAGQFGRREVFLISTAVFTVLFVGVSWNWVLRRTVRSRTRELSRALTEQQRLIDVIQSNEGRLAFAMDVIGEGVWEWDLVTDQIQASTRWAGSFGYRADEAPTTYATWMSYVHPDDRDRVATAARGHMAGETPRFDSTYRVRRKGGDWIWVADRGRIVGRDAAGKATRIVGALKDITMQLAAERVLLEAKDTAEATSRAKSAFLAAISHEMRTPLNAVIGTATLLEHSTLTDDQRELLRLLKRSGDSLLTVVNDVLDFTKIEAGRIELDERPFDLQQTVRDSVSLVEHVARQKELRLESSFAPESAGWLHGDDTRLQQILLNLLSNAVKFTERGGVRVAVVMERATADRVELRIDVSDSGIGIPADRLTRLFLPFSQVDSSTTRRFGGTGLGLAISRRLAELMRGTIAVVTKDGEGSVFSLRLAFPRAEAPLVQPTLAPVASSDARSLRIILAEDNPVNQLVQLRMLRQLGYHSEVAVNGVELLDAMEKAEFDLVLLDIQMPVMDGIEAARELRRRGFTRVRLVALTADVTTETRAASVAVGIDEFLSKPLRLDALAAVLARAEARVESLP